MKKYKDEFQFYRDHKSAVSSLFCREYHRMFAEMYGSVTHNMDFAFYVGIPLFVVWAIWACNTSLSVYCTAAVVIVAGCLIRWHCKHIAKLSCKYFFDERKLEILEQYLAPLMKEDIDADPKAEAAIRKFYESCKWELFDINVDIHNKPKE